MVTKYVYSQGTPDEAYGQPGALFAQGVTPVPGLLTKVIQDFGGASRPNLTTITRDFDGAGNANTGRAQRRDHTLIRSMRWAAS